MGIATQVTLVICTEPAMNRSTTDKLQGFQISDAESWGLPHFGPRPTTRRANGLLRDEYEDLRKDVVILRGLAHLALCTPKEFC